MRRSRAGPNVAIGSLALGPQFESVTRAGREAPRYFAGFPGRHAPRGDEILSLDGVNIGRTSFAEFWRVRRLGRTIRFELKAPPGPAGS